LSEDINKDIKKIYDQDIKEKKQSGRSVHNRTGKGGRGGSKVTTPADLLTGKRRREYEGTSSVTTSNIYYDQIMSLEEFKSLSKQKKMLVLDTYKRKYSVQQLSSTWNLSRASIYNYYKAYGVTRGKTSADEGRQASQQAVPAKPTSSITTRGNSNHARPEGECSFMAVGEFGANSLCKKLQGLSYMLNDSLRYQVEIHVKEIPHRV